MGSSSGFICNQCDTHFSVSFGGGFFFDLLHCTACGATRRIGHEKLGDIHLAYVKGLPGPYAVSRTNLDQHIKATYPGEPLSREAYHAAAEATLEACQCGGHFRYDAPARCPACRSTPDLWELDPHAPSLCYD